MKIKIRLGKEKKKQVTEELESLGVTICEDSELILTEDGYNEGELYCRFDCTDYFYCNYCSVCLLFDLCKKH